MEVHRSALVAHTPERLFDIIEAAEHYPLFLPWCERADILQRDDGIVAARIAVSWRGVRFSFVTRNPKRRPTWMAIALEEGPFRRFDGQWQLAPVADRLLTRSRLAGPVAATLLAEHRAGRANHARKLWPILIGELWAERWNVDLGERP